MICSPKVTPNALPVDGWSPRLTDPGAELPITGSIQAGWGPFPRVHATSSGKLEEMIGEASPGLGPRDTMPWPTVRL